MMRKSPFSQLCNVLLVASLSKTISQSGTRNLDANSIPISEPVFLQILRRRSLDPSKKLDFFRWCSSLRPGYKHSISVYSQIFRTVCRTGLLGEIPELLGSMKDDGVNLDQTMAKLCREGKLERAMKLVEEMETRGFSVDMVTITSLLIGFHKQGRWDWKEKLMKHIREGNLVPNVLRWNAGVEASLKRPQNKDKDYTPMFPNNGSFLDIMSMVGSQDDGARDEEVSAMEDDLWSSSPYMDQLAHQRNRPKPLFSLDRGQRVEAKPDSFDVDMMNTFLSIYLAKGDLSLACKLFEIFNDMGVTDLTSYTYNYMMSSFVKKGHFKTARGVVDQMGESFTATDIATYNVIIQGLGKMGRADLASAVLERLTTQGGYLDIVMYNTLINTLGKANRLDEATRLFEHMKSNGINPDVVSYNTMTEVNSKAGKLKEAYKYLKVMLNAGCLPNHVTDTILDYLGKEMEKSRLKKHIL